MDEIEKTVAQNNIIIVRSAGNGFKDSSDNFAGPLQGRFVAGNRTAGYLDSVFNAVDSDTDKISVGATEYNDTWADFSNYGLGVTTVAPGTRVLVPAYDWTANTTYLTPIIIPRSQVHLSLDLLLLEQFYLGCKKI